MPNSVIEAIRAFFEGEDNVRLAFLFGSLARKRARPDSDVDMAVLFKNPPSPLGRLGLCANLEEHLKRNVDLISLNSAGPVIKMQVLKTGIKILGSRDVYEEFFVKTVREYDDFKQIIAPQEGAVLRRRLWKTGT